MMKSIFRVLGIFGVAVMFMASSIAYSQQTQSAPDGKDNLVYSNAGDTKMQAAMAAARDKLWYFWVLKNGNYASNSNFTIKAALPTPDGSAEHIWVNNVQTKNDVISGVLGNEPVNLGSLKIGDPVTFTSSQVSDWAYTSYGKKYGHFTTRV